MKATRRLNLSFAANFDHVDMVRAAIRGICSDFFHLPADAARVTDFCLIVTELLNNAVEHAPASVLEADLSLSPQEAVFRLISIGEDFDPTRPAAMPELDQGELPEGGYGLALIQSLADNLEYERREDRNTVTLRKTFPIPAIMEVYDGD